VQSRLEHIPNRFVTAIDAVRRESRWDVRAEVVAPKVPTPAEIRRSEQEVSKAVGEPVALTVRARTDVVVTGEQYQSVEQLRGQGERDP
jgi:hypothetical protein